MKEIVKYSLTCARNETDDPDLKKFLTRLIEEKPLFFVDFDGAWSERGLPEGTGYLLLGENIFNGSPIVDLETLGLSAEIIRRRIDDGENFGDIVEEAIKLLKEKQTK